MQIMPRSQSFTPDELKARALWQFWSFGYDATSMDDLVKATGVSRHGIYKEYGGKHALYLACFAHYQDTVVSPAFAQVEAQSSTLDNIRRYFEFQISTAENLGLPGPGCFVGNASTETSPHDTEVHKHVAHHNARLKAGFAHALVGSAGKPASFDALAEVILVFATGLWAASRTTDSASRLQQSVAEFLKLIEGQTS